MTLNIWWVLPFLTSVPVKSLLADASFVLITNTTIFALYIASGFKTVNTAEPSRTGAFLQSIAHSTICTGGHARANWTLNRRLIICVSFLLAILMAFFLSIANTPFKLHYSMAYKQIYRFCIPWIWMNTKLTNKFC